MNPIKLGKREREAAKKAALASLAAWLLSGIALESPVLPGLIGLACFAPSLAGLLYYPKMKKKEYGQKVEACLPFTLMSMAIELNLGMPFDRAVRNAGKGKGCCAREFREIERETREQGATLQQALMHFSERVESRLAKRAAAQLAAALEQGSTAKPGNTIKRIAREILTRQKAESKLFSGKMVVSSLLFIAVSAIVPALFQSFSIIGSAILQISFTAAQLLLITVIGFPALDLAVLLYIRSRTPAFMRESQ